MEIIQSIILGLVQGLGEFLPISSSGHLVLAPWIFGWADHGLSFDVALHLGTLFAVLIYFRKDLVEIFRINKSSSSKYPKNFILLLIIATIPGALAGYFLESIAETVFRYPLVVALALVIFGFLLYLLDVKSEKAKKMKEVELKIAISVGLVQALAIIPGTSRSGVTITAGLAMGFTRKAAARFSFLLSIPIIFGATVFKLDDFVESGVGLAEILGIVVAGVSGYLAIAGLMKFIGRVSYKVFFLYRLILAAVIVMTWLVKM